jgi:hypothetical protein
MNQCCGTCKYFNIDGIYLMDDMAYDCDYPYYSIPDHAPAAVLFNPVTQDNGELCQCYEAKKDV